jgi:RNA polymerase sigma factor (sigma-70 family)
MAVNSTALPPFQHLLDEHREDVWRFLAASVGPVEADDCFQETFLSALRAYPRLQSSSNLRAWVLTIAHRKAIDAHRARARRPLPTEEIGAAVDRRPQATVGSGSAAGSGSSSSAGVDPAASGSPGDAPDLWQAVKRLPSRQRSAVVLRFVADLSHREIGEVIGSSEEAARRSLHEGLKKLRTEVTR